MADDKSIKFRASIDSAEFDRGISEIQRKMRTLQSEIARAKQTASVLGNDPTMGRYAQSAYSQVRSRGLQELQEQERQLKRSAENERIVLINKKRQLDDLKNSQDSLTKAKKEETAELEKQVRLLDQKSRSTMNSLAAVRQQQEAMGGGVIQPPGGGPPGGGPTSPGGGRGAFMKRLGGLASAFGGGALASGIANAIATAVGDVVSRERIITQSQGSALSGSVGADIRAQMMGRGSSAMFFARERAEAMRMAATEVAGAPYRTGLGTLGSIGAGAVAGAGIGSAFGGIGAIPGAFIGGLAGFGGRMISSDMARAQMFDPTRFRSMVSQQGIQAYRGNLEALKARDPRRTMAQEYFTQNAEQIANVQREFGFGSDAEYFGTQQATPNLLNPIDWNSSKARGMSVNQFEAENRRIEQANQRAMQRASSLNQGRGPGFLREQMGRGLEFGGIGLREKDIIQSMRGIAAGGGTTEAARGLSGFGAAVQRQMGFNASGILGQMTGQAGMGVGQTEEAFKKLMAEAQRMGINASNMPKEMQRMTQMTAKLAVAGGGFARGAVEIGMAGVQGFDQAAVAAAGDVAQMFQQAGKAAGGYEGQMGYGYLQSDEATKLAGKKLSSTEMNFLNQFSYTEAREEDFKRIADTLGTTPEKAKQLLRQKDLYKQTRTEEEQKSLESLGTFLKDQGVTDVESLNKALATEEGGKRLTEAQMRVTETKGTKFSSLTQEQQRARLLQLANLNTQDMSPELQGAIQEIEGQLKTRTGKAAEEELGSQAVGDTARIKAFVDNIDGLAAAARRHTEQAEVYNQQFELFIKALGTNKDAINLLKDQYMAIADDLASKFPEASGLQSGGTDQ